MMTGIRFYNRFCSSQSTSFASALQRVLQQSVNWFCYGFTTGFTAVSQLALLQLYNEFCSTCHYSNRKFGSYAVLTENSNLKIVHTG